jgi:hypothetical protein
MWQLALRLPWVQMEVTVMHSDSTDGPQSPDEFGGPEPASDTDEFGGPQQG